VELPWVNEIRAARRRAERAHEARLVLEELLVLQKQFVELPSEAATQDLHAPLTDALRRAAHLLRSSAVSSDATEQPVAVKDAQDIAQTLDALRTLAQQQESTAHALHELQHRQQHDLADPRYADETSALRKVGEERATIAEELPMTERQHAVLGPVLAVIERCLSNVDGSVLGGEAKSALVRARTMEGCVRSISAILDAAGFEHDLSRVVSWSDDAEPSSAQLAESVDSLRLFGGRYRKIGDGIASRVQSLQARDGELERVLLERLG